MLMAVSYEGHGIMDLVSVSVARDRQEAGICLITTTAPDIDSIRRVGTNGSR
jgi:hypothetical protein